MKNPFRKKFRVKISSYDWTSWVIQYTSYRIFPIWTTLDYVSDDHINDPLSPDSHAGSFDCATKQAKKLRSMQDIHDAQAVARHIRRVFMARRHLV